MAIARRPKLVLRSSLLFLLFGLIISVLTTVFFVLVYGQNSVALQRRTIEERDRLFAHTLARSIDVYIESATNAAEVLAATASLTDLSVEQLSPLVEAATVNNPAFFTMNIVDTNGVIITGFNPSGKTEAERYLRGITLSDREYFKTLIATRQTVVSEAITAKVGPIPTVAIAAPIFNSDGQLVGLVASGLSLDVLYGLAEQAIGSEFAVPVVIDQLGQVIVHPDADFVAQHRLLADFPPAKYALAGEEGFIGAFIDVDGVERSAAYAPVGDLGWAVWIGQDTAQFDALRSGVSVVAIGWASVVLLGMMILFVILMHLTIKPLEAMSRDARLIIEQKDFQAQVEPKGSFYTHETQLFATSFNGLIESVKKMHEQVELASSAKSQFLRVTTHAFRTPLTAAAWTLNLMIENINSFTVEQQEEVRMLYDAVMRQVLGFENLFSALEIYEKTTRLDLVEQDICVIVQNAIGKLSELAISRDVHLEAHCPTSTMAVVDEKKLERVFTILLANGIFYNVTSGKIDVTVDQTNGQAVIEVTDTGIGIPSSELPRVFEAFFRGQAAMKKYTDGTGLGLHIAKAFVELQGGTIMVSSVEGRSTTVVVKLPLKPRIS